MTNNHHRIFETMITGAVTELDLDHPVFAETFANILKWSSRSDWQDRMDYLRRNYDPTKVEPCYYCAVHGRLEDSAHRIALAKERGQKTFFIKAYPKCHHERPVLVNVLKQIIPKYSTMARKDVLWLEACRDKKWTHLSREVDYVGKTVLDVGANSGYTVIRSVIEGAAHADGLEIRRELVGVAAKAAVRMGVQDRTRFAEGDWLEVGPNTAPHEIVHCMGMLHYLSAEKYFTAIEMLAGVCTETLVLELRMADRAGSTLCCVSGNQTAPTPDLLRAQLCEFGFCVRKSFNIDTSKRQLWIADRLHR